MTMWMRSPAHIEYNINDTMDKEEKREYAREYRKEGFGKVVDRNYYMRHRDSIIEKQRIRDRARANYRKKLRNTCECN